MEEKIKSNDLSLSIQQFVHFDLLNCSSDADFKRTSWFDIRNEEIW